MSDTLDFRLAVNLSFLPEGTFGEGDTDLFFTNLPYNLSLRETNTFGQGLGYARVIPQVIFVRNTVEGEPEVLLCQNVFARDRDVSITHGEELESDEAVYVLTARDRDRDGETPFYANTLKNNLLNAIYDRVTRDVNVKFIVRDKEHQQTRAIGYSPFVTVESPQYPEFSDLRVVRVLNFQNKTDLEIVADVAESALHLIVMIILPVGSIAVPKSSKQGKMFNWVKYQDAAEVLGTDTAIGGWWNTNFA